MEQIMPDMPDTKAAEARLAKQEEAASKKELSLAKELAARRKVSAAGAGASKTIFRAVAGNSEATAKKTKLGG